MNTVTAIIQVLRPDRDGTLTPDPHQQPITISRKDPSTALARWVCRRDTMQEAGWQVSLWGTVRVTFNTGEVLLLRATFESPATPLEV